MDAETTAILAVSVFAALSSLGVLLARDNFYASVYMSVTMLLIAAIFAILGVHSMFVIIAFIFVGAIGVITVALAATYRYLPPSKLSNIWILPAIITAGMLISSVYGLYSYIQLTDTVSQLAETYPEIVTLLFAMMVLMMLSAIHMIRREVL